MGCRALAVAGELGRLEDALIDATALCLLTEDDPFPVELDELYTRVGVAGLLIGVGGLAAALRARLDGVVDLPVGVDGRMPAPEADLVGVEGLAMGRETGVVERPGVEDGCGLEVEENDFREVKFVEVGKATLGSWESKLLRTARTEGSTFEEGSKFELPSLEIAAEVEDRILGGTDANSLPTDSRWSRVGIIGVDGGIISQS